MFEAQKIDSLELPELQPYRTMRRQQEHRDMGIFVAEGEKVVRRLLESSFGVISVLLPESWLAELEPLLRARKEKIQVYVAEKPILERLIGFSMYQGLLAVGKIPQLPSLEEILNQSATPRLLLAVDSLTDAQNLGTVVRNSAALGVQALLVGDTSCSPFLRRAVRSSMGSIFHLPIVELASLSEAISRLKQRGVQVIGAHPHVSGSTLAAADLTSDCCIVLGSEGNGISPVILSACDQALAIPMSAEIDSLNVGSASAVFLYEAIRQRGRG